MEIVLYHQDGCPQCKMLKMLLDRKSIVYSSIKDIDLMLSLGITHTPTLSVDGKLLSTKEALKWVQEQ